MRTLLINLIVLSFTVLICFAFIEIILRFTVTNNQCGLYTSDNETVYRPRAHYGPQPSGNYELQYTIQTNSLGFRDTEFDLTTQKPRVMCVGDSFTFGVGVEAEETFCKQLKQYSPVQTYNLGVGGYSTSQEIAMVRKMYDTIEPDVVVLGYFQNDINDDLVLDTKKYRGDCVSAERNTGGLMTSAIVKGFVRKNVLPRTEVKNVMYYVRGNLVRLGIMDTPRMYLTIFDREYDVKTKKQFSDTFVALTELNTYLEERGSKLVILVIPDKLQLYPDLRESYFSLNNFDPLAFDVQKPLRMFENFCLANTISCLHVADTFAAQEGIYFKDDLHLNKHGHDLTAQLLDQHLKTEGII